MQVKLDTSGLENLIKSLEQKATLKVGILGSSSPNEDGLTNAYIGSLHEYGYTGEIPERIDKNGKKISAYTLTIPQRSFLRMPLAEKLQKKLEESNFYKPKSIRNMVKDGDIKPTLERIGIVAVSTILDAFDTEGFNKWQPLAARTLSRKKVKQILTETQSLRDSISYEVS